jgi:hypothetical protein
MAPFPPGKGGGEGVAYGRKGKGILIHTLTDAAGMPLSTRTTPANGDERAQVFPLLDALHVRTGQRGRPRKRLRVLAADKAMMPQPCAIACANGVSAPRSPRESGNAESRADAP